MSPYGTSPNDVSMILATKGVAAIESGTIAAVDPIVVPTNILDIGNSATIKIIKGTDLKIFTIVSKILFILEFSNICPLEVTRKIIPKGNPRIRENKVDIDTIYKVCSNGFGIEYKISKMFFMLITSFFNKFFMNII
ncbi:hypothetical protein GCM10008909_02480 [Hathewaya limosa]